MACELCWIFNNFFSFFSFFAAVIKIKTSISSSNEFKAALETIQCRLYYEWLWRIREFGKFTYVARAAQPEWIIDNKCSVLDGMRMWGMRWDGTALIFFMRETEKVLQLNFSSSLISSLRHENLPVVEIHAYPSPDTCQFYVIYLAARALQT